MAIANISSVHAQVLSPTFTYQGELRSAGTPANASFDMEFRLFSASTSGTQLGATQSAAAVMVTGGLFAVPLNFGAAQFAGERQWLEIRIKPAGSGAFETLAPRTEVTAAPYAWSAANALANSVTSTSVIDSSLTSVDIDASMQRRVSASCATGQAIRLINTDGSVSCEASGTGPVGPTGATGPQGPAGSADAWGRLGNAGTNPLTNFLGTTDDRALILRANNTEIGRFTPRNVPTNWGDSPSVALGSADNEASGPGATVSGGGATRSVSGVIEANQNRATGFFATVSGGVSNNASSIAATVGGGQANLASAQHSSVSGGLSNAATGGFSVVSGGTSNCAGGDFSWAGGREAKVRPGNGASDGTCVEDAGDANGDNGTFVWADDQPVPFISTGARQFLVRAQGGMALNTNTPVAGSALTVAGGNVSVVSPGSLNFGSVTRQMINLFQESPSNYGIGVQTSTLYQRVAAAGGFAWFKGGSHDNLQNNPGSGGSVMMTLDNAGQLRTATGTIATLSDARLKDQVANYTGALDRIKLLRPVSYHYRDAGKADFQPEGTHLGFIAQEMQLVFPDWVRQGDDGYLMLSMRGFEAVAVRGMQELSAENAQLTQRTQALEQRLAALEALVMREK